MADLPQAMRWRSKNGGAEIGSNGPLGRLLIRGTGITTDVCVHCTLREANDRGFECLVARDACGSGDPEAHRAALHMVTVEDGVFGALADVDAIVAALDRMDRALATASPKPSPRNQ